MNRAFKYGDAVFETMKVVKGKIPFLAYHMNRLNASLEYLTMDKGDLNFETVLGNQIPETFNGVVRLQVYRNGSSFAKTYNTVSYEIDCIEGDNQFQLNTEGLKIGLYIENYKATSPMYNLKSANYLIYVLAKQYAMTKNLDDAIIVNGFGNIVECINSNIIMYKDGKWISPDLESGPIDGVMLKVLQSTGMKIEFRSFDFQELIDAEGIVLCNAVRGIQWVKSFNGLEKVRLEQYDQIVEQLNNQL